MFDDYFELSVVLFQAVLRVVAVVSTTVLLIPLVRTSLQVMPCSSGLLTDFAMECGEPIHVLLSVVVFALGAVYTLFSVGGTSFPSAAHDVDGYGPGFAVSCVPSFGHDASVVCWCRCCCCSCC